MFRVSDPHDGQDALADTVVERHGCDRFVSLVGDTPEHLERRLDVHHVVSAEAVRLRRRVVDRVLAGKAAARKRAVALENDALVTTGGDLVVKLGPTAKNVELALVGRERDALLGKTVGELESPHFAIVGDTDGACKSLCHALSHALGKARHALRVHRPVDEVNVDILALHSLNRLAEGVDRSLYGVDIVLNAEGVRKVLGLQDDAVPRKTADQLSDDFFTGAVSVVLRRIDEIESGVVKDLPGLSDAR